ncbi:HEPN domain-containing protein [Candidatus Poribacteria bacterium]|nr:HEPN domain-containing protein [Candidatus Poribacteria bacterium]
MSLELDWLAKATENIIAAEICLQHGLRNASVNRAYYAMFHAAIAALIRYEIRKVGEMWKHDFVQAEFSRALIQRRKVFSSRLKDSLFNAMEQRQVADYDTKPINERIARRTLQLAQEFVGQVKEVLQQ